MKILKCLVCNGELDIISDELSIYKKVKCLSCGYTNKSKFSTEVIVMKKKH